MPSPRAKRTMSCTVRKNASYFFDAINASSSSISLRTLALTPCGQRHRMPSSANWRSQLPGVWPGGTSSAG
jgi:hypothetical protein